MKEDHFRLVNNDENYISNELRGYIESTISEKLFERTMTVDQFALAMDISYKRMMNHKDQLSPLSEFLMGLFPFPPKSLWGDLIERMTLSDLGLIKKGE